MDLACLLVPLGPRLALITFWLKHATSPVPKSRDKNTYYLFTCLIRVGIVLGDQCIRERTYQKSSYKSGTSNKALQLVSIPGTQAKNVVVTTRNAMILHTQTSRCPLEISYRNVLARKSASTWNTPLPPAQDSPRTTKLSVEFRRSSARRWWWWSAPSRRIRDEQYRILYGFLGEVNKACGYLPRTSPPNPSYLVMMAK